MLAALPAQQLTQLEQGSAEMQEEPREPHRPCAGDKEMQSSLFRSIPNNMWGVRETRTENMFYSQIKYADRY